MSRWIILVVLAFFATASPASACVIPVFRFALERWAPDLYEVSVFYRGTLSDTDEQLVTKLEDWAVHNGGRVNLEVVRCNLDEDVPDDLLAIWKSLPDAPLPRVVIRSPRKPTGQSIVWHGSLHDPFVAALAISPARREIANRLLQGDAVVWLLVRGSDEAQANRARKTLEAALASLADQLELPAGIGRPGSELLSQVPLQLAFSVVEIAADATDEPMLRHLLRANLSKPSPPEDSLIAPIFGRGRVLTVQSARDLEPETITDLTTYLCSACSCQVKQQNPGFDLLCEVNWDERLFGDVSIETDKASKDRRLVPSTVDAEPTFVAIPAGQPPRELPDNSPASLRPETTPHVGLLLAMAILAIAAAVMVISR
jgi:hypothetical protein